MRLLPLFENERGMVKTITVTAIEDNLLDLGSTNYEPISFLKGYKPQANTYLIPDAGIKKGQQVKLQVRVMN